MSSPVGITRSLSTEKNDFSTETKSDISNQDVSISLEGEEEEDEIYCRSLIHNAFNKIVPTVPETNDDIEEIDIKPRFTCKTCGRFTGPLAVFILLCLVFIIVGREYLSQLLYWLEHLKLIYSLCVFIALFIIISFPFGFGYIILNVAAGYIYGLIRGQIVISISVLIGFSTAFLLCRSCLKQWALQYVSSSRALTAMMRVIEGPHGFKVILLTRLTPIPFGLQNALFAITEVSFIKAVIGSVIGLLPTQLINTYMGSTVRNMTEVLSDRADGYLILLGQVLFSVILSLYLVQKARQELVKLSRTKDVETGQTDEKL